jgi:hypothetical protein
MRPPPTRPASPLPIIKAEPRDDDRDTAMFDHNSGNGGPGGGSSDAEEELRAQLELAEATANAAKLRLQVLNAKSKKRNSGGLDRSARSGTVFNPMSLDD